MRTALELKDEVVQAIGQRARGEIDMRDLYAAVDLYIESLRAYKKRTGKKFRIPTRAYVIRAFR